MSGEHHPSCTPNDRDLMWVCSQCGLKESAADLEPAPATAGEQGVEQMSERLHVWYLEGTRELDPANFNPKAQKSYAELNEQQKEIDRYIARKFVAAIAAEQEQKDEWAHQYIREIAQLREQLDSANEELYHVCKALERAGFRLRPETHAALAKIKEGKSPSLI